MGKQDKERRIILRKFKTVPVDTGAEGGGMKLRFTRNPKKNSRTLVRVIFTQTEPW
jgi:hypothetical protein